MRTRVPTRATASRSPSGWQDPVDFSAFQGGFLGLYTNLAPGRSCACCVQRPPLRVNTDAEPERCCTNRYCPTRRQPNQFVRTTGRDGPCLGDSPFSATSSHHTRSGGAAGRRGRTTTGRLAWRTPSSGTGRSSGVLPRARGSGGLAAEVLVACNVLNQMTDPGRPASYAIGR